MSQSKIHVNKVSNIVMTRNKMKIVQLNGEIRVCTVVTGIQKNSVNLFRALVQSKLLKKKKLNSKLLTSQFPSIKTFSNNQVLCTAKDSVARYLNCNLAKGRVHSGQEVDSCILPC